MTEDEKVEWHYQLNGREGNGNPLQYSCLGNLMDRGAWWATVHEVAKSQTRLSDRTHTHTHIMAKVTLNTNRCIHASPLPNMPNTTEISLSLKHSVF